MQAGRGTVCQQRLRDRGSEGTGGTGILSVHVSGRKTSCYSPLTTSSPVAKSLNPFKAQMAWIANATLSEGDWKEGLEAFISAIIDTEGGPGIFMSYIGSNRYRSSSGPSHLDLHTLIFIGREYKFSERVEFTLHLK